MAVNWVDRVPTRANRVRIIPEDGSAPYYAVMERADEPSVVGTPVNAANLNAMQNAAGLTANKTIYVATTGSNTTGDGSQSAPYSSISKAMSTIPKNLNGFTATINIASGSYNENVNISGYSGGRVLLTGDGGGVTLNSLTVSTYTYCLVNNMALTLTPNQNIGIKSELGALLIIQSPISINGTPTSGVSVRSAFFHCRESIEINNASVDAIVVYDIGHGFFGIVSGAGNRTGLSASYGGILSYQESSISAETLLHTGYGGRIFGYTQTETPRY